MGACLSLMPIAGCSLYPLGIVPTPAGAVLHLLKAGSPLFPDFPQGLGEIYFSEVYAGQVKAWKCHSRQSQNMAAVMGLLRFALYDDRSDSPTLGRLAQLYLGRPDHYSLLHIPPGVWYGFQAIGSSPALICNCPDIPHDPTEGCKLPLDSAKIPYVWAS